jgi:hypothetical protein
MEVRDLDLYRAFRRPNEANPELVVDPDRVLSLAIVCKRLKSIAWRRSQIAEIARGIEVAQFPPRHLHQSGRKTLRTFAIEDGLGGFFQEAPDHAPFVSLNDTPVKVRPSISSVYNQEHQRRPIGKGPSRGNRSAFSRTVAFAKGREAPFFSLAEMALRCAMADHSPIAQAVHAASLVANPKIA